MIKAKKILSCFILVIVFCFVLAGGVFAEETENKSEPITSGLSPDCMDKGNCKISEFTVLVISIFRFVLGIVGSVALLFFVYGGVLFITSAGSAENVTKAKNVIIGSVIGIVLIFTSYMIVQLVIESMGIDVGPGLKISI